LALGGIEGTLGRTSEVAVEKVSVYRVFGQDAKADGFSWTPVNPLEMQQDYHQVAKVEQ